MEIQRYSAQTYVGTEDNFDPNWLEEIILLLGDAFDIRISWDRESAILTGVGAVAGGLLGSYAGGRLGAALGAGIGSATGLAVATMISLREVWASIKDKLKELFYIVFNFLRQLDPIDYMHAFDILMASRSSRRELVYTMLDFIAVKLGRQVISSITVA